MGQVSACLAGQGAFSAAEDAEADSSGDYGSKAAPSSACSAVHTLGQLENLLLPTVAPLTASRLRCFVIARPDRDEAFRDQRLAGHPQSLELLRAAGASVSVVRASCMCQGHRLAEHGEAVELLGEHSVLFKALACGGQPEALARGLTHLRCWAEAPAGGGAALILDASAQLAPGFHWGMLTSLVLANGAEEGNTHDLMILTAAAGQPAGALALGYAFTRSGCVLLAKQLPQLAEMVTDADVLVAMLTGNTSMLPPGHPGKRASLLPLRAKTLAVLVPGEPANLKTLPAAVPPPLAAKAHHDNVKVVIITLPHRADRRIAPLVGGKDAIAAMREEGCDVEVMRASCYCERDRLNEQGSLCCFVDQDFQWVSMRRYQGAEVPVGADEAQRLRKAIDQNYISGADRLCAPEDGTVEGYIVDSNWPGATSCAVSHMRALLGAAVEGYEYVLIFEDDAVIPAEVARERSWCSSCTTELCFCPSSWGHCVSEAVELARRAPSLDALYLGLGEVFERPGKRDGILAGQRPWFPLCWQTRTWSDGDSDDDLGGITEIGYTWQAQAILYTRSALEDVLALRLCEQLWAHDETIPHLYGRKPWNHRYVEALQKAGWQRRWVAGAPSDFLTDQGWVLQLESFTTDSDGNMLPTGDLGLGTAWQSSNSQVF